MGEDRLNFLDVTIIKTTIILNLTGITNQRFLGDI